MKIVVIALVATGLLLTGAAHAQPRDARKPWKPASLPANAIQYGSDLDANSSESLKRWAQDYVKAEMRIRPADPKPVMTAVDARFPASPEEARDAIMFLLFYLAYKDEDENQRLLDVRIRDIDRETIEMTRQLQQMWKNQQSRAASPNQSASPNSRVADEENQQRMESRLREYADERQLKSTELTASRKKINAYLKLLDIAQGRMKGVPPAVVKDVVVR